MKKVIAILASVLLLAGCSTSSTAMDLSVSEFSSKVTEAGIITLDVRTPSEFNEGHIEGASLIDFQVAISKMKLHHLIKIRLMRFIAVAETALAKP